MQQSTRRLHQVRLKNAAKTQDRRAARWIDALWIPASVLLSKIQAP